MPWRSYQPDSYRFGYQGQEKDKDEPAFINFELRQYDPRIGRWFNPDPMGQYHSPYLAMGNNPISFVDPMGGEAGQFDPICGCVPSSNDMVVKPPRDPYGFFSGSQGHFYQIEGAGGYFTQRDPSRSVQTDPCFPTAFFNLITSVFSIVWRS